jgi:hypothetical protein
VSRYEQTGESDGFHSARITVKYLVLGTFESGIGFTPSSGSESYEFKLKETDGVWHIESTDPDQFDPHISKPRVIQWLQEKLKTTTDAGEKISIDTALKQLLPTAK